MSCVKIRPSICPVLWPRGDYIASNTRLCSYEIEFAASVTDHLSYGIATIGQCETSKGFSIHLIDRFVWLDAQLTQDFQYAT